VPWKAERGSFEFGALYSKGLAAWKAQ